MNYSDIRDKKYRLDEPLQFHTGIIPPYPIKKNYGYLSAEGVLSLKPGFCSDGATGAIDTKDFLVPAFVHDWFCDMVNDKTLPVEYRRKADDLLKQMLLDNGMSPIRAEYVHRAVVSWGQIKHAND
jgi:hypothetical protein